MPVFIGENRILTTISDEPLWSVVKAESAESGEQIWFKILNDRYSHDEEMVARFHESARLNAPLKHPNILSPELEGSSGSIHFALIKPFMGNKLSDLLKRGEAISPQRAITIILQIAKALQHAHLSGIMHGALTADCVYLDSEDLLVVTHFASDKLVEYAIHHFEETSALPIALYCAPERLVSEETPTTKSELYSLGMIFYQLLSGHIPFRRDSFKEVLQAKQKPLDPPTIYNPDIPPGIEASVMRLLAKEPEDRYPNVASFIEEFEPDPFADEEEKLVEEKSGKIGFRLWKMVSEFFGKHMGNFDPFSPTLVGSRRRMAYFVLTVAALISVATAVALLSEIGSDRRQTDQLLYREFIAETDSLSALASSNENMKKSMEEATVGESSLRSSSKASGPGIITSTLSEKESSLIPMENALTTRRQETSNDPTARTSIEGLTTGSAKIPAPILSGRESPLPSGNIAFTTLIIYAFADSQLTHTNISLNGEVAGQTSGYSPLRIHGLVLGKDYSLEVIKPGYKIWQQRLVLRNQDSLRVNAYLESLPDALRRFTLAKVDFADRVIVDNRLPSYPLPYDVDLALGSHHLKYISSGSTFSWETRIIVDMDSESTITFDAEKIGYGQLAVVLENAFQFGYAFVSVDGKESKNQTTPFRVKLPVGRHKVRVSREGFVAVPNDTIVHVALDQEVVVPFRLARQ